MYVEKKCIKMCASLLFFQRCFIILQIQILSFIHLFIVKII